MPAVWFGNGDIEFSEAKNKKRFLVRPIVAISPKSLHQKDPIWQENEEGWLYLDRFKYILNLLQFCLGNVSFYHFNRF